MCAIAHTYVSKTNLRKILKLFRQQFEHQSKQTLSTSWCTYVSFKPHLSVQPGALFSPFICLSIFIEFLITFILGHVLSARDKDKRTKWAKPYFCDVQFNRIYIKIYMYSFKNQKQRKRIRGSSLCEWEGARRFKENWERRRRPTKGEEEELYFTQETILTFCLGEFSGTKEFKPSGQDQGKN